MGVLSYRAGRFEEAFSLYKTGCGLGSEGEWFLCLLCDDARDGGSWCAKHDLARDLYQRACSKGDQNACGRFYKLQGLSMNLPISVVEVLYSRAMRLLVDMS